MSEHTPEPWRVLDGGCDGGIGIVQTSHVTRDVWEIPRCVEDLHRIVACVNACAGMDDPAAEIKRLRARVAELEAGRDRWKAEAMAARELLDSNGYYLGWRCDNLVDSGKGFMPRPLDELRAYISARAANGEVGQ